MPPHLCWDVRQRGVLGLETGRKPSLQSGSGPNFLIQVCIRVSPGTIIAGAQGSRSDLVEMEGEMQGGYHMNHLDALWSSSLQSTFPILAPRTQSKWIWSRGVCFAQWASVPVCAAPLVCGRYEGDGCN